MSSQYESFGFRHCIATFFYVWEIQTSKVYTMVISMLQNLSKNYYSHNSSIKCIDSTVKCIALSHFITLLILMLFHPLWFLTILILCFYRCFANWNQ